MVAGSQEVTTHRLARLVLVTFILTFALSRIVVLLIMTRRMPDLYFYAGQTHVHHLNYGIFLLSGVGAYLLFARPAGRVLEIIAVLYGIGLALTFDEFGMWLHLGGGYWQRASYDAVVVIAAILGLIVFAPHVRTFRLREWIVTAVLAGVLVLMGFLLRESFIGIEPRLESIEQAAPQ